MPAVSKVHLTFLDDSLEKSSIDYYVPALTAVNFAASLDENTHSTAGSIAALFASLSLCTPIADSLSAMDAKYAQTPPGSDFAQREIGLMLTYTDTVTGKSYRITVPGPDWTNIRSAGTDMADMTSVKMAAFKTAFEEHVVSPDGNAVSLVSGRLVGRNR